MKYILSVIVLLLASQINAASFTIGLGTADAEASKIVSYAATTNYVGENIMSLEVENATLRQKALFKFPTLKDSLFGRTVTLAYLYHARWDTSDGAWLHCYPLKRYWKDSTVTYNTTDGSTSWGTAGANNTTSDYDATVADSIEANDTIPPASYHGDKRWSRFNVTALLQQCDGGDTANYYGFILDNRNGTRNYVVYNFIGPKYSNADDRPALYVEYSTGECVTSHSVTWTDSSSSTLTTRDAYTNDSTVTQLKLIWDDDTNPASPLGEDSIKTSIGNPETLTATGLSASTTYYLWWVLYNGTCTPDTSDMLTAKTTAAIPAATGGRVLIRK